MGGKLPLGLSVPTGDHLQRAVARRVGRDANWDWASEPVISERSYTLRSGLHFRLNVAKAYSPIQRSCLRDQGSDCERRSRRDGWLAF